VLCFLKVERISTIPLIRRIEFRVSSYFAYDQKAIFIADIRFDELDEAGIVRKEREIESNLERYKLTEYWKGGLAFYDFSTMEPPLSDLSQSEIISGDIIAMKSNGAFTIEYRGVNKNKVKRFLDLLME